MDFNYNLCTDRPNRGVDLLDFSDGGLTEQDCVYLQYLCDSKEDHMHDERKI